MGLQKLQIIQETSGVVDHLPRCESVVICVGPKILNRPRPNERLTEEQLHRLGQVLEPLIYK